MSSASEFIATLPFWIARRRWRVVVKLGGSAMDFFQPIRYLKTVRGAGYRFEVPK